MAQTLETTLPEVVQTTKGGNDLVADLESDAPFDEGTWPAWVQREIGYETAQTPKKLAALPRRFYRTGPIRRDGKLSALLHGLIWTLAAVALLGISVAGSR